MPMHGGAFGERVVDLDAQAVALAHAQHRARYLAVVGPYIRGGILARDELHARRPGSQAGLNELGLRTGRSTASPSEQRRGREARKSSEEAAPPRARVRLRCVDQDALRNGRLTEAAI